MITVWCSGITQGGTKCKVTTQRARNAAWFCNMHKEQAGMLHMTQTFQTLTDGFTVHCRCGWRETGLPIQNAARKAGDEHLKEANADDHHPG